ncbi:MAG TPA: response regulator [Acidimicrobiia bacterium]|nr:response regulator [Acidimicrobiia bacterium]
MALVLVVDDDPDIVELIQLNLELAGHRVITAGDGKAALDAVQRETPDAILLDLMMPGLDGWAVIDKLKSRSDREVSEIPVFMVTARAEPQNRIRGGIEGAIRYITKPFDPAKLADMIADAVGPGATPEPEQRRRVQQAAMEEMARRDQHRPPGP